MFGAGQFVCGGPRCCAPCHPVCGSSSCDSLKALTSDCLGAPPFPRLRTIASTNSAVYGGGARVHKGLGSLLDPPDFDYFPRRVPSALSIYHLHLSDKLKLRASILDLFCIPRCQSTCTHSPSPRATTLRPTNPHSPRLPASLLLRPDACRQGEPTSSESLAHLRRISKMQIA